MVVIRGWRFVRGRQLYPFAETQVIERHVSICQYVSLNKGIEALANDFLLFSCHLIYLRTYVILEPVRERRINPKSSRKALPVNK